MVGNLIGEIRMTASCICLREKVRHCRTNWKTLIFNAYVSHYKKNEMNPGDNPPVGILLCTRKGKQMVEYALAGMDNQLFISTYMLQIPDKKTLEGFLLRQLAEMQGNQ